MSDFDRQLHGEEENTHSLSPQRHSLPADFSEDDLAFVEELHTLFALEAEELPPYYVQTLSAAEDLCYYPFEPGFEQKTRARVFHRLHLRHHLLHTPRSLVSALIYGIRGIAARRSLLASAATLVLMMLLTVALTAPSFAAGMAILLHGARGGVYVVNHYPNAVHKLSHTQKRWPLDAETHSNQISLLEAQQELHFPIYWPQALPTKYSLNSIYLYQTAEQLWTDGPMVELVYELSGVSPKGTGQIVIREFKPTEEVLQLVQDHAAHPIQPDQQGRAQAIYVDGQWTPHGRAFLWTPGQRSEVISQQNGVIFWIAGDQRDGVGEKELWKVAQSFRPIAYSRPLMLRNGEATDVTQAALGEVQDPYATDVLVIAPDGSATRAYFITVSSYQSQSEKPVQKTAKQGY
jgi:hypothetical protein